MTVLVANFEAVALAPVDCTASKLQEDCKWKDSVTVSM